MVSNILTSNNNDDRIFGSNNEMKFQLKEDIKDRIFDTNNKEEYLKLQELIECTYTYFAITGNF